MTSKQKVKVKLICYCHEISEKTVAEAIARGCSKVDQVSDATTAGIGPCGGTCRPEIQKLILEFNKKKNKS